MKEVGARRAVSSRASSTCGSRRSPVKFRTLEEYREQMRHLPARLGVAHRVHYFDAVPYAQLTTAASGANIGIMAIDPVVTLAK